MKIHKAKKLSVLKLWKHPWKTLRFNSDIAIDLDVKGTNRIYVEFTIDKLGNVTKIKAQGPHEKLEKEARRVVGKIPKMIPGKQNNTNVSVIYTLPIVVRVQY